MSVTTRAANRRPQYEEREGGSGAPARILTAVTLFGLAILLIYICLASPQPGTSMGAIRSVLQGLGGGLAIVLPLVLVWAGMLCVAAARDRRP